VKMLRSLATMPCLADNYVAWILGKNLAPFYPGRNCSRSYYNNDNPDGCQLPDKKIKRVGRGSAGKDSREMYGVLIESLKASLFDPKLLVNILTLSGETDFQCLFYTFMSMRMYPQITGLKPLFKRSIYDKVTYTTNHRLGMVGMMDFLCDKLVISREQKLLLLSILRKNHGKSESSILVGYQAARMRGGHTLTVKYQGIFYGIETYWINFKPGMTIITKHQKDVFLANTFMKYASLVSSIPDEYKSKSCGIGYIYFPQKQSLAMLKFLESLHYILFNLCIENSKIRMYFMREYARILLEFTVCSTKERVDIAIFNLFGGLGIPLKDSEILSGVVKFMQTYNFCASELYFFQKEVEKMLASSGIPDAKFLRKIREKNAFWNMLMFVIFSQNDWAKKHSQPCLPVEILEAMLR
jgi:hypothetical protein